MVFRNLSEERHGKTGWKIRLNDRFSALLVLLNALLSTTGPTRKPVVFIRIPEFRFRGLEEALS
jgi:hypothetical protein